MMCENILEFVQTLDARASKSGNPLAYKAGYLESMLSHLIKDVPDATEWLARRVEFMQANKE